MKRLTIIIALLLTTCAPAHAGGLTTSIIPPERPSYAPLLEGRMPLERCERPVYGRNGQVLYWTGQGCVEALEDGPVGSETPSVQNPPTEVKEGPEVKDEDTKEDQDDGPCKSDDKNGVGDSNGCE